MCRAVQCRVCDKTTWAGCGSHIDAVRRSVPAGHWCSGHAGIEVSASRFSLFKRNKK